MANKLNTNIDHLASFIEPLDDLVLTSETNANDLTPVNECSSINFVEVEKGKTAVYLEEASGIAGDEQAEDYLSLWHKNHHGSIDLDEKLTSMTGSYSEILDDRLHHSQSPDADLADSSYMNSMQVLCANLDEKKDASNSKEASKETMPKGKKPNEIPYIKNTWNEQSADESLSYLARDFSDKNSISNGSTKRRECLNRNLSSTQIKPRKLLYPALPPIDPTVIGDLEDQARNIATSMDTLIENLTGTLHSISALSVECVETYRDAVCKTCDAVDSNIKSMYQLMAKCEELSKSMKPIYKLHDQIKEIRRLLDLFEGIVQAGGGGGGGGT